MFKILNSQSQSVTGAAIIIGGATLVNKFIGIARDRAIFHFFSAGPVTDAYYAAFKIPDLIFNLLVVGALTAGFIPVFTKLFHKGEDKSEAWKLASNVLNITGVALTVLGVLGALFASPVMRVIAPGFSVSTHDLAVPLMRVMFLSPLLLGLSMVVGGIMQSLRRFVLYSIAPIFYNLGIIFGAWFLVRPFGPVGLAYGVVLGALMHFLLQLIGAYQAGFQWTWNFNLKDKNTHTIWLLMIPRTMGLAIANLNTIIITAIASTLAVGSVAVYTLADNLQWVPIGIIGISFSLAVFPILSAAAAENDEQKFITNLDRTARQILFLTIPTSIIFLLLRAQIVRVIYGTGAFDWSATINTANALAFFALGLCAQSLIPLFARAFYALSDTKTPFFIGIGAEACILISAYFLSRLLGVAGLSLAISIGAVCNLSLLVLFLRKKIRRDNTMENFYATYKMIGAAIVMGIIIQLLKYPLAKIFNQDYFWGIFGQGAIAGLAGLGIYAVICYILRLEEMNIFASSLQKKWLKIRNVPLEGVIETHE
ncbi:MAG: murein biosynthesis integral membrane protein MurJ [bacterium]|nr:murein biosynthesis integral membrane protein MurJ [bacterium]